MSDKSDRPDDSLADQDAPDQTPGPAPASQPVVPAAEENLPESLIPRDLHQLEVTQTTPSGKLGSGSRELVPGGRRKLWISLGVLASAAVAVTIIVHYGKPAAYDPARLEGLMAAFDSRTQAALAGDERYRIPPAEEIQRETTYLTDLTRILEQNQSDCVGAEASVRERWQSYSQERARSVLADAALAMEGKGDTANPDQASDSAVIEQDSPDQQALVEQISGDLTKLLTAVKAFSAACPVESGVLDDALGYPWI